MDDYEKIFSKVKLEDLYKRRNNVLIENKMDIHDNMNIAIVPTLKNEEDYYGINLALIKIIPKMNITNELIVESNELYKELINNKEKILFFNTYSFSKYYKLNEYIVHDLRTYCDQLLTICYLLKDKEKKEDICLKSTGDYLNLKEEMKLFKIHDAFIKLITDLDNSYKHSFSNCISDNMLGENDNCIITQYSKFGKDIFKPQLYSVKLDDLINGFNSFYNDAINYIDSNK